MRHLVIEWIRSIRSPKHRSKTDVIFAFILSLSVTVALVIYIKHTYQLLLGPDDVGIRNIVSGLYTGSPEAHSYFMRYPLTALLSFLYKCIPHVYWYAYFLAAVNYGCFLLFLYKIIRRLHANRISILLSALAIFLIMWLPFFITLEWTTTAGIAAATGIFWFATTNNNHNIDNNNDDDTDNDNEDQQASIPRLKRIPAATDDAKGGVSSFIQRIKSFFVPDVNGKDRLIYYIPSFILFFLAWNIRNDVALLSLPFWGVVFLWKVINKQNFKGFIAILLICASIMVISNLIDGAAYSSDAWKEADDLSDYRSSMYDRFGWPDYEENEEVYTKHNISYEMYQIISSDYNMMLSYKGVLEAEDLRELAEISEESFYSRTSVFSRLKQCVERRWDAMHGATYRFQTVLIYAGLFFALVYAVRRKNIFRLVLVSCSAIGFEAIWLYLYFRNRLPIHVGYSLNMMMILVVFSFLWNAKPASIVPWRKGRTFICVAVAACLAVSLFHIDRKMRVDNDREANNAQLLVTVKQYCEDHPDNVYYRDFFSFNNSILYKELISQRDEEKAANFIPPNGWSVVVPLDNQFLPTDGNTDLCSWLQGRTNYYFLVDENSAEGRCQRIENLFSSRGITCNMVLVDTVDSPNGVTIGVYQFQWE